MSIPPGLLARRTSELPRQLWHLGGLMSIRVTAGDTDGALSVVEQRALRGYATPPHVHSREDETLVVLEGELEYTVGGRDGVLRAGESVFLPRHTAHRFAVISERAHYLMLITPGGFEEMFQVVSSPAAEERLPDADDAWTHTDPDVLAAESAARGTTVFRDDPVERARQLELLETAPGTAESYRCLAATVAGPGPTFDDVIDGLVVAAKRIPGDPGHARALILLGILAETSHDAVSARLPGILDALGPDQPESVLLALAFLGAHFREHSAAVLAVLRGLPDEDRQRLERCLADVDPSRIGRSWPTPALWELSDSERELDRRWRAEGDWDAATVQAIWDAETTSLLAFMGAKADHHVERNARV
ncbi:cupin domain-containing protein [Kutzneria kofuensis]|uniref:Quercetin dioxygenase-like cupin family protein n=1 Tax=Kutzneria kofuensis TaxID=103725 RepID=A0A7W9KD51_9PSEU|nr:cupin domain-containing protein [Kutzneria kofuensis]MBB5890275.1 quercetin dioxygenase-like cupin family protein [Kutzneria kofuensis]